MNKPDRDDPVAELVTTGALLLVIGAVIAAVIGAVELGQGSILAAAIAWSAAAVGLGLSFAHFMAADEPDDEAPSSELPFPSWLRTEADA